MFLFLLKLELDKTGRLKSLKQTYTAYSQQVRIGRPLNACQCALVLSGITGRTWTQSFPSEFKNQSEQETAEAIGSTYLRLLEIPLRGTSGDEAGHTPILQATVVSKQGSRSQQIVAKPVGNAKQFQQ